MAKEAKVTSARRFGPRYGRTNKHKFNKIELEQRKLHECPYCSNVKVKRVAYGIWQCKKCDSKFTGKAYTLSSRAGSRGSENPEMEAEKPSKKAPAEE